MSLKVEIAGFGLCQTTVPYPVLVICVQQESFQGWTVYRRHNSFMALGEQLKAFYPNLPPLPYFDSNNLSLDYLENFRFVMDRWLQSLASNPMILRTQCMYQFLCMDANLPPPYLNVYWRQADNQTIYDEMDMEEMFDKGNECSFGGAGYNQYEDYREEDHEGNFEIYTESDTNAETFHHGYGNQQYNATNVHGYNHNGTSNQYKATSPTAGATATQQQSQFPQHQETGSFQQYADNKKRANPKKIVTAATGSPATGSFIGSSGASLAKKKHAFESHMMHTNFHHNVQGGYGSGNSYSNSHTIRIQGGGNAEAASNHQRFAQANEQGDEDGDGLDIQSLSFVEAEFLYDKADNIEGKLTTSKIDPLAAPFTPRSFPPRANPDDKGKSQFSFLSAGVMGGGPDGGNGDPVLALGGAVNSSEIHANTAMLTSPAGLAMMRSHSNPIPSSSSRTLQSPKKKINLDSFHIIRVIGKGSFGKVFLAREKATSTIYALKVLKKEYIIRKNQVEHTRTERSVLGYVHHPFIVGLNMAFQTPDKLFFVLDYCAGGELFFHLGKSGRFPEERAKFYASQIILALEYVHSLDIIYRDLKPENVLLDHLGNVRLTDFGLSKEGVSDHSTGANSFCGTPEYIAPEVLLRQGHGRAVDWWSLGALLYEMISGLPPFYSRNREQMFDKIMNADLNFPPFMSEHARDVLSKLLVRDPRFRLGSGDGDALELKQHSFFVDVDWDGLYHGRITSPWTPTVNGSLDTSQFDQEFTSMHPAVSPEVRGAYFGSVDRVFEGFSFVDESMMHLIPTHQSASITSSIKQTSGSSLMASFMGGST